MPNEEIKEEVEGEEELTDAQKALQERLAKFRAKQEEFNKENQDSFKKSEGFWDSVAEDLGSMRAKHAAASGPQEETKTQEPSEDLFNIEDYV